MASLKAITLIMALVLWSPSTFLAGTVAPYVKATYEIPDTLIPSQGLSTAHHSVSRFLFQGLFRINRNMLVDPDLVATWEVSRDGRLFRFQLAEAAFSNGDTVTSFDVVNSLRFLIRESRNAQFYYQIEKVYSDGPGTVVVKIAEGFHQLIELLAAPQAGIWKQKNGTILGSGPMMAHRVSAGRLELVSSGNYRGKFRSNLSSLTFLKVEEFQKSK